MNEWAEIYKGSHRLTGRRANEPTRCANGDIAPGWVFVGDMSEAEFSAQFVLEEHGHCHNKVEWTRQDCPHCTEK